MLPKTIFAKSFFFFRGSPNASPCFPSSDECTKVLLVRKDRPVTSVGSKCTRFYTSFNLIINKTTFHQVFDLAVVHTTGLGAGLACMAALNDAATSWHFGMSTCSSPSLARRSWSKTSQAFASGVSHVGVGWSPDRHAAFSIAAFSQMHVILWDRTS